MQLNNLQQQFSCPDHVFQPDVFADGADLAHAGTQDPKRYAFFKEDDRIRAAA